MEDKNKKKEFARAIKAYRKSNEGRWVFAFHASNIVGKYGKGGTLDLAKDMSVSTDTVEDHAHAYWMYDELRNLNDGAERLYVQTARKLPYVYYSHFRALYDLKSRRNLTNEQIMNMLIDVVQAEGGISSRDLENHAHQKYGDTRDWSFYAQKANKELSKTIGQPDLPNIPEAIGVVNMVILSTPEGPVQFFVVAYTPRHAEGIARKQLAQDRGKEIERESKCIKNEVVSEAITDSHHILKVASSWLGDNA